MDINSLFSLLPLQMGEICMRDTVFQSSVSFLFSTISLRFTEINLSILGMYSMVL